MDISEEREPVPLNGFTSNSFTSVSRDPLLILVCVNHEARLLSFIKSQRRFGVSILREDQQALSEYFAKLEKPPEEHARLGIRYRWTSSGIPLLDGTLAQLACNVVA